MADLLNARFPIAPAFVDPRTRTLETDDLVDSARQESGRYCVQVEVRTVPGDTISLALDALCAP